MRLITLLLLSLVLALSLIERAGAARGLELAVQDDAVLLHRSYGDAALGLRRAGEMGASRIRVNLSWAGSMPAAQAAAATRPGIVAWDFSRLERLYEDAKARGLALQVTLDGPAPAWATGDGAVSNDRPSAARFAEFASAAARSFAGRVDRWSIWNEPNWHRRLSPAASAPGLYRALFRSGAAAVRAADPAAEVLIGELMPGANTKKSTRALHFLRAMTCSRSDWRAARRCAGLRADGFALHPYNFSARPSKAVHSDPDVVQIGSLGRLTRALDRLRARGALVTFDGSRMPVFITEFGYFTSGPVARSASTHAAWMREAWRLAERNPRVRQLLQYLLIEPWPEAVTWRTAVLERDGAPRPVFEALRKLASAG